MSGKLGHGTAPVAAESRSSFELGRDEEVADGIRRIALDLLETTLDHLEHFDRNPGLTVHKSRTGLKKLKAMLRLVSGEFPRRELRTRVLRLRDAGRELSELRDGAVHSHTLELLIEAFPRTLTVEGVAPLRVLLRDEAETALRSGQTADRIERATVAVGEALEDVETWPLETPGFDALRPGLRRTFTEALYAYRVAYEEEKAEHFHGCRKRFKDLWYQMRILEPIASDLSGNFVSELEAFTDAMGLGNDLEALATHLEAGARSAALDQPIIEMARAHRSSVWRDARTPMATLMDTPTHEFVSRFENRWTAWRA